MSARAWRGPGRGAFGVAVLMVALAGCAPHRLAPARLEPASVRQRFERALEHRVAKSRAVDQEITLWAKLSDGRALPGVSARLLMAGPDAFRLRVASPFGVALDAAAARDSVAFLVPRERLALVLPAAAESLGIPELGVLGCRLWSATWSPAADAWGGGTWKDSLFVLGWREGEHRLELAIGSNGLPAAVAVERQGRVVTARYAAWSSVQGISWPARAEGADDAGRFEITTRIQRVRFEPRMDPARLRIEMPERTRFVTLAEVAARLQRLVPH